MADPLILSNALLVTREETFLGSVTVAEGIIQVVRRGSTAPPGALDLEGRYLLPGLVEIHTDNVERHLEPRPGVHWPDPLAAVLAHDAQVVSSGITTVMDAIALGEYEHGGPRRRILATLLAAIREGRESGLLKADHGLHLRCELADPAVTELFDSHAGEPAVRLVSLMDHTPGQRQFQDIDKWREFHRDKNWSDRDIERLIAEARDRQARLSRPHRDHIVAQVRRRGLALASHDDTTIAHVDQAVEEGATIAEFPVSREAADRSRAVGLRTVMGAPNVVRGGSHSGNISALDLAREGLLDALSSDYAPFSLIQAPFLMAKRLNLPLPHCMAMVTDTPARMLGFRDRGRIEEGTRADLVDLRLHGDTPSVRAVWRTGTRIL
ncbi:MAG: alpha-D-ribose 1-methylphosphonate 5-triphosphate diphosphatase [Rhodospirillum sp.]|nr:alpha-D-ribose 1-methylphosphonate 5-triphosphate diphosphatase [Rhodospirillum sp.]MCF8489761.1 alpha-D-ribose 1-methylphosphonate 5-triphosphate diphosphatase [Rhodospirillum sp.]MCF8501274.1 alpha-D-ribose 1-methylphosphonate 5-triphosphate diphosphatase [Rhodospirillum sp.]